MDRVGDDLAGFSVGYDPVRGVVEVSAWGFWSADVAAAFPTKVTTAVQNRPGARTVILDVRDLKPMREEGQRSFSSLMRALPALGVTRTSVVTTSHLTKLQLVRIATESGLGNCVEWVTGTNSPARNA